MDYQPIDMNTGKEDLMERPQEVEELGMKEEEFKLSEKFQRSEVSDSYSSTMRGCLGCCGSCLKCICLPCYCCGGGTAVEVRQGFVALVTEFGRFQRVAPPGAYIINQCSENYTIIDMRTQVDNVSAQHILTSDNVSIRIDAVVYYQIKNCEKATYRVVNYKRAIDNLIKGSLKNIVGENKLQQLLDDRKIVDLKLAMIVDKKTDAFGIKVFSIETKEIFLPASMQRAMATVAESLKQKEAKVIDAEGQLQASSILRQAADEMTKNPASLQLQYYEVLKQISVEKNSTIIVPDNIIETIKRNMNQ